MNIRVTVAIVSGLLVSACQSNQPSTSFVGGIDGNWSSVQHGVVTTFQGGHFTTKYLSSMTILAEGDYSMAPGNQVTMEWKSARSGQKLSATCQLAGAAALSCQQGGGTKIDFQRAS
jgi:hypothetical protein